MALSRPDPKSHKSLVSWVDEVQQFKIDRDHAVMEALHQERAKLNPGHTHSFIEEIASHTHSMGPGTTRPAYPPDHPLELQKMLAMRMRGKLSFSHVHCQVTKPDTVVVFLIANNEPVTLEDNYDLFPSDALITKLRLLAG